MESLICRMSLSMFCRRQSSFFRPSALYSWNVVSSAKLCPDAATSADHALEIACGFWTANKINAIADTGDFVAVTRAINGGTKGLADRRAWLDKVIRTLAAPTKPAPSPAATVVAVQRALQKAGFPGVGAADGDPGPRTMAAITEFRRREGLPTGGIDAVLLKALKIEE